MNLLAVSGCDSVVQSAVVEEKNPTDQKERKTRKQFRKQLQNR